MFSRKRSSSCELEAAPEQENIARQRPKSLGPQEAHEWLSRQGMAALLQLPQEPLPPSYWCVATCLAPAPPPCTLLAQSCCCTIG